MLSLLRFEFLGSFAAFGNGQPITKFRSAKTRGLLIFLVLEAFKSHSRVELATLFWPEKSAESAKHNLRQSLYQLRRILGNTDEDGLQYFLTTRQTIQFNPQVAYSLDVKLFAEALEEGDLDAAETLYTGHLLPTFSCESRPFEEWLERKRQTYQQAALEALHDLAERQFSLGNKAISRAQTLARRQLELEPWREEAHRQLMRALALAGDRTAAIAQFDRCTEVLWDELGVSPAPATFGLFDAIRDGTLATLEIEEQETTVPHNLPYQATRFVGRSAEIDQLSTLLQTTQHRLVSLVGAGGIGKTRLALHVAHQLLPAPTFADGIYFVPLAALTTAAQLPEAISAAVGFRWQNKLGQLIDFLAPKSLLLILDNLEHIQRDSQPVISTLLQRLPNITLCVTTRQSLNRRDEQTLNLQGLSLEAARLLDSSAAQLFLQVASGEVAIEDEKVVAAIGRICRLTEGVPLAILLSAAWTNILHPTEIADQIERDLNFLGGEMPDLPPRQRSLRATFAYSWALLTEAERHAFAALTVFRGGFSRRAAQHVAGINLRTLAQLVRKSLVGFDAARQRYTIHELLRQFGNNHLTVGWKTLPFSAEKIYSAHSRYYLTAVAERVADMLGRDQAGALRDIAAEIANLQAAWQWATAQQDFALLNDTLQGVYYFYFLSGRELQGIALFENSVSHLERETPLRLRLQNRILTLLPDFDDAIVPQCEQLHTQFAALNNSYEQGLALNRLADAAIHARDITGAMQIYATQIALFQGAGASFEEGLCLTNMMRLGIITGMVEHGLAAGERAASLFEQHNNRLGLSVIEVMRGIYHTLWTGNYAQANIHLQKTLAVGRDMETAGHVITGVVMAQLFAGFLALLDGDAAQAQAFAETARPLAERKNTAYTKAGTLGLDALLALTNGNDEQAFALSERALGLSQEPGSAELATLAYLYAACRTNRVEQAQALVQRNIVSIIQHQKQPNRSYLLLFVPVLAHLSVSGNQALADQLMAHANVHAAAPQRWWQQLALLEDLNQHLVPQQTPRDEPTYDAFPQTLLKQLAIFAQRVDEG